MKLPDNWSESRSTNLRPARIARKSYALWACIIAWNWTLLAVKILNLQTHGYHPTKSGRARRR
jgi:hypothetical protein